MDIQGSGRIQTAVILAPVEWNYGVEQGSHIFAKSLSRLGLRVIWLEPIPSRFPGFSIADFSRVWKRLSGMFSKSEVKLKRTAPDNVVIIDFFALPESNKFYAWLNKKLFLKSIRKKIYANIREPCVVQSWKCLDGYLYLLKDLACRLKVYCVIDNYVDQVGAPKHFRDADKELCQSADIVFARTKPLIDRSLSFGGNVIFRDAAVDFELFSRADNGLRNKAQKIGYYGVISDRLNFQLLRELGEAGYQIVLLGPIKNSKAEVFSIPNISYMEAVPYNQVADKIKDWDAFVLPYMINSYTEGVLPMKIYEMLATGKPVISVPLPFADKFRGLIYIAQTANEFKSVLSRLSETEDQDVYDKRKFVAKNNSWDKLIERELVVMNEKMAAKSDCQ